MNVKHKSKRIDEKADFRDVPDLTKEITKGEITKIKAYPKQPKNDFVDRVHRLNLEWIKIKKDKVFIGKN